MNLYGIAEPGDTLWSIARRTLSEATGREPADEEVSTIVMTAEVPSGDFSVILPGDIVSFSVGGPSGGVASSEAEIDRGVRREVLTSAAGLSQSSPPRSMAPSSFASSQGSPQAAQSAALNTQRASQMMSSMGGSSRSRSRFADFLPGGQV